MSFHRRLPDGELLRGQDVVRGPGLFEVVEYWPDNRLRRVFVGSPDEAKSVCDQWTLEAGS